MDEIELDGKKFISARRAAKEHGYAPDYIGQLIRGGKLVGRKVGRGWFVELSSLEAYFSGHFSESVHEARHISVQQEETGASETPLREMATPPSAGQTIQKVVPPSSVVSLRTREIVKPRSTLGYPLLTYLSDDEQLLPVLRNNLPEPVLEGSQQEYRETPTRSEQEPRPEHSRGYGFAFGAGTIAAALSFLGFLALSTHTVAYDAATQSASSFLSLDLERLKALLD